MPHSTPNRYAGVPTYRDIKGRFGQRLKELRESRGMTQLQMAIDFEMDRSFISDCERGRKEMSLSMLHRVAVGFQMTLCDLFEGVE